MKNDFHSLCSELVKIEDAMNSGNSLMSNQGQALDGFSALAAFRDVANRARASLAQMGAESPSDEELDRVFHEHCWCEDDLMDHDDFVKAARAVFARWGRRAPQPIPVSEWLPGEADCDAEGQCWSWDNVEGSWYLWKPCPPFIVTPGDALRIWLPYWALPIPSTSTKEQ